MLNFALVSPWLQLIGAGKGIYDMFHREAQPAAPPVLGYDEALSRAEASLNPVYDRQLRDTLQQVDNANMSRGFYGQLPGDVLSRSTAADIQGQRIAQIANLAQQMSQQSAQNSLTSQQLAAQWAQQQAANRQQGLASLLNTGTNIGSWVSNLWQNFGKTLPMEVWDAIGIPGGPTAGSRGQASTVSNDALDKLTRKSAASSPAVGSFSAGQGYVAPAQGQSNQATWFQDALKNYPQVGSQSGRNYTKFPWQTW